MTAPSDVIVETASGALRGLREGGVSVFRNVPYAASTAGANRFRPPQPREAWHGVRDATLDGPACIQSPFPDVLTYLVEQPQSEDSLTVNIWTPDTDATGLPIMVFFHGGAYIMGANSVPLYDGTHWAEQGVIAVTVNYRLAAMGYLYLDELFDDLEGTGILGSLDAAAAVDFIARNARAFGGDASNITIMGSSAGGGQVCALLGMPDARPNIRRAFPMSIGEGQERFEADGDAIVRARATETARAFLGLLGVQPGDTEALRELPASAFIVSTEVYFALAAAGVSSSFGPVPGAPAYPESYRAAIARGETAGIDLLAGVAADEQGGRHTDTVPARESWKLRFGMQRPSADAEVQLLDLYPAARAAGSPTEEQIIGAYTSFLAAAGRPVEYEDIYVSSLGDSVMVAPTVSRALLQSEHAANTRMLLFAWPSPMHDGAGGSFHGLATPMLFNNLDLPAWQPALGSPVPRELADRFFGALVQFVKTGDPQTAGLPYWPVFEPTHRSTMVFGETVEAIDDPLGERLAMHRL